MESLIKNHYNIKMTKSWKVTKWKYITKTDALYIIIMYNTCIYTYSKIYSYVRTSCMYNCAYTRTGCTHTHVHIYMHNTHKLYVL